MAEKTIAPYGSWKSPITTDLIVSTTSGIGRATQIMLDGADVYWSETRPSEGGRYVVIRRTPDGASAELVPAPLNARSTVYEYGGGSFTVSGGDLYFSNFDDQRLYRQSSGALVALTPAVDLRYADGVVDTERKLMFCVREDHTTGARWPINTIVSLDLSTGGEGTVLVSGNDFYSTPRLSGDGKRLAWTAWDHPNMPWDSTQIWVADVNPDGSLANAQKIAGDEGESVTEPGWTPNGDLIFISDRTNWWNLYRWRDGEVEALTSKESEFTGRPGALGSSSYSVDGDGTIVCAYSAGGTKRLVVLGPEAGDAREIESPYTELSNIHVSGGRAVMLGGSPTEPASIVIVDISTGEWETLRSGTDQTMDSGYLSAPRSIEFPTEDGLTAHAYYYAPANKGFEVPEGELPPLIVFSHGGPVGATSTTLDLNLQHWVSRGFAVVDVNYGGSIGYGREYRERLKGRWGIVDVDDCINAAKYLISAGEVDGERVAVRGGSAGGYTTLASLTFRDFYKAGASHYGLSELEVMVKDTHKYESRYLDSLIAVYPEGIDVYKERSPVYFADQISCPLILFQGLEDKVVPPNQAELMLEVMRAKGLPVAYVPFEGEQHGFRRAENIKRALDLELYFYSRVFGFELADPIDPIEIENL